MQYNDADVNKRLKVACSMHSVMQNSTFFHMQSNSKIPLQNRAVITDKRYDKDEIINTKKQLEVGFKVACKLSLSDYAACLS